MSAPTNLHSHTCTHCDWDHCYCYANPCVHRWEQVNTYECGFCRDSDVQPVVATASEERA